MTVLRLTSVAFFLGLALRVSLSGQERRPQSTSNSCREFVEKFYSWYLANPSKENRWRAGDVALKYRSYLFSSAIVEALQKDNEAQDKAGSDLVSLDADPFVGADGLAENYIVKKVTVKDGRCWAEVHAVWGEDDEAPDVTPELTIKNGKWRFVNFYFPSPSSPKGWDLLGALKELREGRKQYGYGKDKKP